MSRSGILHLVVCSLLILTRLESGHPCTPLIRNPSAVNDCLDIIRLASNATTGFYDVIQPDCAITAASTCTKRVFCDMTTEGGGWTVIQQRRTGSVEFFVPWNEYKLGFGNDEEWWVGNEYVRSVTNRHFRSYDLLIVADDVNGNRLVSRYSGFKLGPEATSYQLSYNTYSGNYSIDNLSPSRNQRFGTYDVDTDSLPTVTCGTYWRSGWWFEPTCLETGNLNLPYGLLVASGPQFRGIQWRTDAVTSVRLLVTQMKIRPALNGLLRLNVK